MAVLVAVVVLVMVVLASDAMPAVAATRAAVGRLLSLLRAISENLLAWPRAAEDVAASGARHNLCWLRLGLGTGKEVELGPHFLRSVVPCGARGSDRRVRQRRGGRGVHPVLGEAEDGDRRHGGVRRPRLEGLLLRQNRRLRRREEAVGSRDPAPLERGRAEGRAHARRLLQLLLRLLKLLLQGGRPHAALKLQRVRVKGGPGAAMAEGVHIVPRWLLMVRHRDLSKRKIHQQAEKEGLKKKKVCRFGRRIRRRVACGRVGLASQRGRRGGRAEGARAWRNLEAGA
mmetsp:Transcript_8811/g.22564  ORF Transcript_8811/g.22564 Transcript_8811/m.22564 type:complete len:286 (+) Transcript_8811:568-1425(+)